MSRAVTAIDTNVLFHAIHAQGPEHARARAFLDARLADSDTLISELALVELYALLRNPAVVQRPLSAADACARVQVFRTHPSWRLVDHCPDVMDEVWRRARSKDFARGRIVDARLALSVIRHGATRFATRNVEHFAGMGFDEVFDPLQ